MTNLADAVESAPETKGYQEHDWDGATEAQAHNNCRKQFINNINKLKI